MNPVPEKLASFRVYKDGVDLLGVADVELPELESMTDTVKGAGIAGEVDTPVQGHFGSMTMTLNWRTVSGNLVSLATQQAHQLDLRGSIQSYNSGEGTYRQVPLKVVVKAIPKKTGLGKMDVGSSMENGQEFEVVYIKATLDGSDVMEIDKYNFICLINGEDQLADMRANLGLS